MEIGAATPHAAAAAAAAPQSVRHEAAVQSLQKATETQARTVQTIVEDAADPKAFDAKGNAQSESAGKNLNASA